MAALEDTRNTKAWLGDKPLAFPQAAATTLFQGALAVLDAGYLTPGRTATGLVAVGRVKKTSVNAGSAGAVTAEVERGIFRWANGDSITQADVGKKAYVGTDQDVFKSPTGRSPAGVIVGVDSIGVWVATGVEVGVGIVAPSMQAVDATLVAGTVTIATGITVASNSEVAPILIGPLTGTTNFGQLGELKASRVTGAPGVGTIVVRAYGDDGALDADAAGAIRVLIFTP